MQPTSRRWTRRTFLHLAGLGALGLSCAPSHQAEGLPMDPDTRELLLYVGTYTERGSEGIYRYRLDLATGALRREAAFAAGDNPSYLALDPQRRYLFAVNEVMEHQGQPGGAVTAFALDPRTGDLRRLNQQPTRGGAPCYVTTDAEARNVLVANYMGGNVTVLPVQPDGTLRAPSDTEQHRGTGPNADRQEGPHAHCIVLDASGRHAFAVDLGIDQVVVYRFDPASGQLATHDPASARLRPGAGPRHLVFHPAGRHAFVINELDSTLTAFAYDPGAGALREVQTLSTLPEGFTGTSYCADVHVSPSGRFVYGSNRGHNSIAAFAFDPGTGRLTAAGHTSTQGDWPRNFAIDPSGRYLLVANQRSDAIVVFRLDPERGGLTPTGHRVDVPSPVCLKLIAPFA